MRYLIAVALLFASCKGFQNPRVSSIVEVESIYSHNALVAAGFGLETDRHRIDLLGTGNFGVSDHRDHNKVQLDNWGGILRWRIRLGKLGD